MKAAPPCEALIRHQRYEINKMLAIVKVERQGTGAVFRANLAPNRACGGGRSRVGACEATARPTWSNGYATIERVNFSVRAMSNESTEKGAVRGFWEEFRAVLRLWP
jgi:hypothetical protein